MKMDMEYMKEMGGGVKMGYKAYKAEKGIVLEEFFSLFEQDYSNDFIFPGETHDFWEIVYVREGDVCVSADERVFHLSKGGLIFHKPMELHKFHVENGKPARLFIMSFNASGTMIKRFEDRVFGLSREQRQTFSDMISFLYRECKLSGLGEPSALKVLEHDPVRYQVFVGMAELLLLSLLREGTAVSADEETAETIIYRKAVQVMEKNISEWIGVPEIADECNVSISYLKKVFAKYAGLGVHQYFLKTKIVYASRMLKAGKSVAETAAALSFSSPNYFSTVYKRETGMTPMAYKNNE